MMNDQALFDLTARDVLHLFKALELSPLEFMRATLERCETADTAVRAKAFLLEEQALQTAKLCEKRYLAGTARPLEGLPTAIKDETMVAGQVTANGSLLSHNCEATSTDPVPERLLAAGAIIHLRATAPEWSCGAVTWSHLWGVTRNPWNLGVTPGGSSGGCAAALASGMASIANATDNGGSIRIPAALCGLVGVKASHGRIPEVAPYNADPYCHHGYLARSIEDATLLYDCLAGEHRLDPASKMTPKRLPKQFESVQGLRVAASSNLGFYLVEDDVIGPMHTALGLLEDAGAKVEEIDLDWDERVISTARTHQFVQFQANQDGQDMDQADFDRLTPYYRNFLSHAMAVTKREAEDADRYQAHMAETLKDVFSKFDVLVCPTVATTRVPADFDCTRDEILVRGKRVDPVKGWFMTYAFNTLGQHPVICMPTGLARNRVPTSVQVIARPYEEPTCFRAANALAKLRPGIPSPPFG